MTLNTYCLAITALSMMYLAGLVYRRASDRPVNKLFAVYAFAAALWVTTNFLIMTATDVAVARFWVRAGHIASALGAVAFVEFAWVFPASLHYQRLRWRILLLCYGLLGASVAFMPQLILDLQIRPNFVEVTYGWPVVLFLLFLVTTLAYGDLILVGKWRRARGLQRVQIFYVLTGLALAHSTGIVTILIIPLVAKTTTASGWGAVGHIFAVAFIAYAIAKHHLMETSTALRRWVSYALTTVVLMAATVLGVMMLRLAGNYEFTISDIISRFVTAGMLAIVFAVIHRVIQARIEAHFSRQEHSFLDIVEEVSQRLGRTLAHEEIYDLVTSIVINTVHATSISVYGATEQEGDGVHYRLYRQSGLSETRASVPQVLASDDVLVQIISQELKPLYRDNILRFRPLQEARPLLEAMDKLGAEVVVPIKWMGQLSGMLCVGARENNQMYTQADLRLLENVCGQIALLSRNAELYIQVLNIKELFEMILRRMDSGVIAIDEHAEISVFNPAAARMIGVGESEMLGRSIDQLPEEVRKPLEDVHRQRRVYSEQKASIRQPSGKRVPIVYSISLLTDVRGEYRGAVMVFNDMSVQEALQRKQREAEQLSLLRTISAGMAHEIRNPLVAIRTFAELAPTHFSDPEFQSSFAQVAREEIDRIERLVEELLMLARPIQRARSAVDMNALVQSVVLSLSASAKAKGVEVSFDKAPDLPTTLADDDRLRQAVMNVLLNAVEATPNGGQIRVSTEHITQADGESAIVIRVWNSGSSIDEGDLPYIFDPFYTTKAHGTGLGLAICQSVMKDHGGMASVRTDVEGGTEFVLTLPTIRPTDDEAVPALQGGDFKAQ